MQKIRKEEKKGAYLQTPTFATTLKLLLLGALLKLLAFEAPIEFALLGWKL
jgi:hypothetical protein